MGVFIHNCWVLLAFSFLKIEKGDTKDVPQKSLYNFTFACAAERALQCQNDNDDSVFSARRFNIYKETRFKNNVTDMVIGSSYV